MKFKKENLKNKNGFKILNQKTSLIIIIKKEFKMINPFQGLENRNKKVQHIHKLKLNNNLLQTPKLEKLKMCL